MDYARDELLLVPRRLLPVLPGVWLAGTVPGPARGVAIDPTTVSVTRTLVSRKRARQVANASAAPAPSAGPDADPSLAADTAEAVEVLVTRAMRVRGPRGVLGRVTRLWVARVTGQVTHVLIREQGALSGQSPERIVPVELVELAGGRGLLIKLGAKALRELAIYRPDSAIEADVRATLQAALADPRARRAVKVHVDDGHVTLAGTVDTTDQLAYAERAAMVVGVRGITVDLVAEETLAAAVEARFAALPALANNGQAHIRALAEHGIVYLEGVVASAAIRDEVERAALAAAGARVVVNNVRVGGEPPTRSGGTGPLVRNR